MATTEVLLYHITSKLMSILYQLPMHLPENLAVINFLSPSKML